MHASLTPKNNLRLLALFALILVLVAALGSVPLTLYVIGAALGAVGGFLQVRAIRQVQPAFLSAETALAVRRALASSGWGKTYLVLFWFGAAIFVTISILLLHERFFFGWLAAYCSFVIVRDLLALPATYELQRRATSNNEFTSGG